MIFDDQTQFDIIYNTVIVSFKVYPLRIQLRHIPVHTKL